MNDNFEDVMSKRTDDELTKIISSQRGDYQPEAVEAAEREIEKRHSIKVEIIASLKEQTVDELLEVLKFEQVGKENPDPEFLNEIIEELYSRELTEKETQEFENLINICVDEDHTQKGFSEEEVKQLTKKCPKCGTEFLLGTKFCENCDCNLEVEFIENPVCPKCGKTFSAGIAFCSEDGTRLVSPEQMIPKCVKCGKAYTDGTKFCSRDGGKVVPEALRNRHFSANDLQTTIDVNSNFAENLRSNFSISIGVLAGTVGVILFSRFNWIKIAIGGDYRAFSGVFSLKATLFNIASKLNNSDLRYFLGGSAEFTLIRIVSVILVIAMILSFVLLIASLVMKSQSKLKPTLAYSGFGLCAIVTAIFIIAMIFVSIKVEQLILTVFPFLTLVVAIAAMIFAVKRPTKKDFLNAAKELQQK